MPDYRKLQANLEGLTGQFLVSSSIDFLRREGESLVVDWFLQLRGKADNGILLRRREQVTVQMGKGPKPKIVSLAPLTFFAPVLT